VIRAFFDTSLFAPTCACPPLSIGQNPPPRLRVKIGVLSSLRGTIFLSTARVNYVSCVTTRSSADLPLVSGASQKFFRCSRSFLFRRRSHRLFPFLSSSATPPNTRRCRLSPFLALFSRHYPLPLAAKGVILFLSLFDGSFFQRRKDAPFLSVAVHRKSRVLSRM